MIWQMVSPKITLTKIGWMTNRFNLWLSSPWIGNYDLLLTTSSTAQKFFEYFRGLIPTSLLSSLHFSSLNCRLISYCLSPPVPDCVPFYSPKESNARLIFSSLGLPHLASPIMQSRSFEGRPISRNSTPLLLPALSTTMSSQATIGMPRVRSWSLTLLVSHIAEQSLGVAGRFFSSLIVLYVLGSLPFDSALQSQPSGKISLLEAFHSPVFLRLSLPQLGVPCRPLIFSSADLLLDKNCDR
jgi:hypothetical protein